MSFLILPHQLYDIKYIKPYLTKNSDITNILIWEHPHYFIKYNYNKKKLMLHRASMRYYHDYITKYTKCPVKYCTFDVKPKLATSVIMFDPIDKIKLPKHIKLLESPNFLLTKNMYSEYRNKTSHFIFYNFYMWGKKQINVIPTIKSTDKENRKPLPKNIKLPKNITSFKKDADYIAEAASYVKKHFPNNLGNTNNFIFPISHTTTKTNLKKWIVYKFKLFGDYQDAIHQDQSHLFHSILSGLINIGLINPHEILNEIKLHKDKIPINSYEGYIRQLFWREYQRYCYLYIDWKNENYFGNVGKLNKSWYNGSLGIQPVDVCIKRGIDTAYLNHIERLMIIGNFMNLSGISPKEGYRWFMEFSFDSYDWVMAQNVFDMVFFTTGGKTTRRPYISSSNYVMTMSNFSKSELNWPAAWDQLYVDFLKKHKKKLYKFRYFFKGL